MVWVESCQPQFICWSPNSQYLKGTAYGGGIFICYLFMYVCIYLFIFRFCFYSRVNSQAALKNEAFKIKAKTEEKQKQQKKPNPKTLQM